MRPQKMIRRAEKVELPQLSTIKIPAKIDTGADVSSIWAHSVEINGDHLEVVFFGPQSKYFTGEVHDFGPGEFEITRISNSFGDHEFRYKVKLRIKIKRRLVNATFTLADRSRKSYPVLIGCSLLNGKFIVDVAKGSLLVKEEAVQPSTLKKGINQIGKEIQ